MEVIDPNPPTPPPGQDELPCEDGEPMGTPRHLAQMHLLIETIKLAWSGRRDFFVGGNMFVYFSELQSRGEHFRGPDFFVVLDSDRDEERRSWVAWQEGGKLPDVVIELLSDSTAALDRGEKMRIYERVWRTANYVLFDPGTLLVEAFELVNGRYQPLAPDASGSLPIARLGLSVCVRAGKYQDEDGSWLRFVDARGNVLATQEERAVAAEERAAAAERELAELRARAPRG